MENDEIVNLKLLNKNNMPDGKNKILYVYKIVVDQKNVLVGSLCGEQGVG